MLSEIDEQLGGRKARAVFLLERAAQRHELLGSHHVDIGHHAAGIGREAPAEDRADIGFAHVGHHFFLEGARGFHRLHHKEALFQLLDIERLDRLITDISDASRLDAELSRLEVSPTDIGAMLRALVDMHETTRAAGSPRLVLELPAEPPGRGRALIVAGIESRLSQIILNVIANAVSFSPPDGEIRIRAAADGRAVLVTVEDRGPGIPEDKLTAIFDRFYCERPASEKFGTHSGLGLSISKQIVEAHRGRIWAENRTDAPSGAPSGAPGGDPGGDRGATCGARFVIRLPAQS